MICLFYRWRISQAIDNAARRLPHRHLERCPQCRQFHAGLLAMGKRLEADAKDFIIAPASATVAPRQSCQVPASPRIARFRPTIAQAVAAAAVLVLGLIILLSHLHQVPPEKITVVPKPAPAPPVVANKPVPPLLPSFLICGNPMRKLEAATRQAIQDQIDQTSAKALNAGKILLSCLPINISLADGRPEDWKPDTGKP